MGRNQAAARSPLRGNLAALATECRNEVRMRRPALTSRKTTRYPLAHVANVSTITCACKVANTSFQAEVPFMAGQRKEGTETVSGSIRRIFRADPKLLRERSNKIVRKRW